MQALFEKLQDLGINYTVYEHEPLFTVEQALKVASTIPGAQCKNLFLKDSKNNFYLIVALHDTQIHLKSLSKKIQAPELRFASAELLKKYVGVEPGSVTPFGLIHDVDHKVTVLLDAKLLTHEFAGFHPLKNDATVVIATSDLIKFIENCHNRVIMVDFCNAAQS